MKSNTPPRYILSSEIPSTRCNVLDYGLVGDGMTDNTQALKAMLEAVPEGSSIYFPVGLYVIRDTIEVNKAVQFVGDNIFNMHHSSSSIYKPESAIMFSSRTPANTTMFVKGQVSCGFKGLTFYGAANATVAAYSINDNNEQFDGTLPYPYYKEQILKENINGIDMSAGGAHGSITDCVFSGFSGYGVKINDHRYIRNCAFGTCNVCIEISGTDSMIQHCWFCHSGTAIHTGEKEYSNLQVTNCWCDQMAHHFISMENSSHVMVLVDDVWVDMIDESAIYIPNAQVISSRISGRFSRCGMSCAGLTEEKYTAELKPMADVIYCKRIYNSELNVTMQKRVLNRGNNPDGECAYHLISTKDNLCSNCTIIAPDATQADIGSLYVTYDENGTKKTSPCMNNTTIHTRELSNVICGLFSYSYVPLLVRAMSPVNKFIAPVSNSLFIDSSTGDIYLSTGSNDSSAWQLIVKGVNHSEE